MKQHVDSQKHKAAVERNKQNSERKKLQTSIQSSLQSKPGPVLSDFNMDLCQTFLEAGIPLNKVNHPSIERFIEKYTTHKTPDESTLRLNYVPNLYDKMIEKLRAKAAGKRIWITLDETTDKEQRMVANFVFGILDDENERGKSYLFNAAVLERTNANTIATFFTDSLMLLWPSGNLFIPVTLYTYFLCMNVEFNSVYLSIEGILYENVLIVATDAAAYMLAAMRSLAVLFPKMVHVTCLVHGLHRLAEYIRTQFPDVNILISTVKSVFVKVCLLK